MTPGPFLGGAARRIGQALIAALGATMLIFAMLPLAPGDPALRVLYSRGITDPNDVQIAQQRAEMGLDRPLPVQYVEWLGSVMQGDLGTSYRTGRPVAEDIAARIPATFLIVFLSIGFAVAGSVILALIAAATRGRWPDLLIRGFTLVGASMPSFLFALFILHFVIVGAGIGRVLSQLTVAAALLPALALAIGPIADWTQMLRANLLDALNAGHVAVARARGASRTRVILRYALPNAILPLLTAVGVAVGGLMVMATLVEDIFTWPGLGSYALQAINARDFPVIQAFVLLGALSYVTASLVVDLIAMWLDPRIRSGVGGRT